MKAIANNEETCINYVEVEFIEELMKKWEEEELIMQSLTKIKVLLEEWSLLYYLLSVFISIIYNI